jgi:hypothetical protein
LPRLRLAEAADKAAPPNRPSRRNLAAALAVQTIEYLCEASGAPSGPEVKRRFSLAIQRAETWAGIGRLAAAVVLLCLRCCLTLA